MRPWASAVLAALLCVQAAPLSGQVVPRPAIDQMDWQIRTIRDSGQPVIPAFEGWYQNPDGTYDLCFGFFNLNRVEALDVPHGPDNFIEPARFDGAQPTHFSPLGEGRPQREYCVFVVNVPSDIGDERVWWNLRFDGQPYRVPGHVTVRPYMIDNLVNSVGSAMEEFEANRVLAGAELAPVVRFVEPQGPEARGKGGAVRAEGRARVGTPMRIRIQLSRPSAREGDPTAVERRDEDAPSQQLVKWTEFSGPAGAPVTFSTPRAQVTVPGEHSVQATFPRPGDYVLLAQVLEGSFANLCCWTNAYVRVVVEP